MRGRRPGLMVSVGRHQSRAPIDEVLYIYVCRLSVSFFCSRRPYLSFLSFLLFMYVWSLARCFILLATTYMLPRAYLHLYSTSRHLCLSAFLPFSVFLARCRLLDTHPCSRALRTYVSIMSLYSYKHKYNPTPTHTVGSRAPREAPAPRLARGIWEPAHARARGP